MDLKTPYAFGREIDMPFADAVLRVREELAREGFGILTDIDVRQKFAAKLRKDFRDYVILGACNPSMAYLAFQQEINIGVLLPCNVVVYTNAEEKTVVMVMDPVVALGLIGNEQMTEMAGVVRESLLRMIAAL